jgi:hypothetical protein
VQRVVASDLLQWVGVAGAFGGGSGWRWWWQKVLVIPKPNNGTCIFSSKVKSLVLDSTAPYSFVTHKEKDANPPTRTAREFSYTVIEKSIGHGNRNSVSFGRIISRNASLLTSNDKTVMLKTSVPVLVIVSQWIAPLMKGLDSKRLRKRHRGAPTLMLLSKSQQ